MLHRPIPEIVARRTARVLPQVDQLEAILEWQPTQLAAGPPERKDVPVRGTARTEAKVPRLLVVEDDWFVSIDIETALAEAGYEVVEVTRSAEEAVRAALQHIPDLVLMDIRLLGQRDGIDAAREIMDSAGIPSLFVSAHADETTKARAAAARPAGWVTKPFLSNQLLQAVRQALEAEGFGSE